VKRRGVLVRFLGYVGPYRWWVALAFTSTFVVAVGNGALAGLIRPLFDDVLMQQQVSESQPQESAAFRALLNRDLPEGQRGSVVNTIDRAVEPIQVWWRNNESRRWKLVLWIIVIVYTIRSAAMFFSEYSFEKVGLSTVRDMRNDLYEAIINQSFRFFSKRPTGELVSRIVSDVEMIQNALSIRMSDLFQHSATLLVLVVFVVFVNTELAILCFVVAPVIIVPVLHFAGRMRRATHKTQERMADVAMFLEETIKGVRIVKAFGMEKVETLRFRRATQQHLDINLKSRRIQAMSSPVMELIGGVCAVLLIGYAAYRIKSGLMTIGQFFSFVVALTMMYTPIKRLNKANLAINAAISATQRVFDVIDTENEIVERPDAISLSGVGRGIEYCNVRFAYGSEPVLKGINLTVAPGEMVAIVGTSGAGKTTLVNLLPRFYDVTDGAIRVDGIDVRDMTMVSLRSLIGVVTQEVVLFNDTVRNNIAYGREDVAQEALEGATRAANALDFVEALPLGFDTSVGESGVLLSGGQRQRLAIARAILKDPPILILDEATSALDTESERLVQQALANLMTGRTTLVIAHRLSTVRRADRIIVLDAGEIREMGTHESLIELNGIYRRLHEMQFAEDETAADDRV